MEKFLYTCQYCAKDYKPNRRKKQKYCSNSCRVRAFKIRNTENINLPAKENENSKKLKIEKMSFAGVGNAAVGTLAVNLATSLLTKEENKPATKKDINQLISFIKKRYFPVYNLPLRNDGTKPHFDLQTSSIIYI